MKTQAIALVLVLFAAACGGAAKPATATPATAAPAVTGCQPPAVVGDWRVTEGTLPFEEINLAEDGSFSSFMNEQPFSEGTWSLDGGALVLTGDTEVDRIDAVQCSDAISGTSTNAPVRLERVTKG